MMLKLVILSVFCAALVAAQGNIVDEAEKIGATEFVRYIKDTELVNTLSSAGPFTVFAPSNKALAFLPEQIIHALIKNSTFLTQFLSYHVVKGTYKSTSLTNDMTLASMFNSINVRINIYNLAAGQEITAEGSPVTSADNTASNGVIHLVDKVLFPIPEGSVLDILTKDPLFSDLVEGVQKANLASTLNSTSPFTLFAPGNSAFQKLPPGVWDKLLSNVTALTEVLTYHLLKGTYYSRGFNPEQDVPTVEGKSVHITRQEIVMEVNGHVIILPNLSVTNGVIHIINSVLLPPGFTLG